MAEWRYLRRGSVAHALQRASDVTAACGIGPWSSIEWFGTGSQSEYEHCEQLPTCRRCAARLPACARNRPPALPPGDTPVRLPESL